MVPHSFPLSFIPQIRDGSPFDRGLLVHRESFTRNTITVSKTLGTIILLRYKNTLNLSISVFIKRRNIDGSNRTQRIKCERNHHPGNAALSKKVSACMRIHG